MAGHWHLLFFVIVWSNRNETETAEQKLKTELNSNKTFSETSGTVLATIEDVIEKTAQAEEKASSGSNVFGRPIDGSRFVQQTGNAVPQTSDAVLKGSSERKKNVLPIPGPLDPAAREELQKQCIKVYPVASKFCNGSKDAPKDAVEKCAAYARDCYSFIPKPEPLDAFRKIFASSFNYVPQQFGMNGIPYYPINQEGSVAEMERYYAPFGTFGGGYSQYHGVRDFWSQYFDAGANWIDGDYGYKTGWSMPLVQSLGVEGQGGTHVSVPLNQRNFGKIGVDSGYQVGGYYGHNDHLGVDWKEGNVNKQFGVAVPFVGVGFNTGTSFTWPSVNKWTRALTGYRY